MIERSTARRELVSTVSLFLFFVFSMTLLSVFLSSKAKAQSAALANDPAALAASAEAKGNQKPFSYNGQFLIETTRTADEAQPISYIGWYMLTGSATHKATAITATARASYAREYTYIRDDGTNGYFDNPTLSVAKSFRSGRDYNSNVLDSVSLALTGSIGANHESQLRTFLWSNGLSLTGAKSLGRFNLRQAFGYTRSFFEYDIRDSGVVNSPDTFRSVSSIYYDVNERLSLGVSLTYAYAVSFQQVGRGTQFGQATIDYMITDKIVGSVGIASERSTLEPDGQTDRIRIYAPEAAQYFVDLMVLL